MDNFCLILEKKDVKHGQIHLLKIICTIKPEDNFRKEIHLNLFNQVVFSMVYISRNDKNLHCKMKYLMNLSIVIINLEYLTDLLEYLFVCDHQK